MSLQYVQSDFLECIVCRAKPGSPPLCRECLERRELYTVIERIRKMKLYLADSQVHELLRRCPFCDGFPKVSCPEHGR